MTYPIEVKARAIELMREGYGTPTIEKMLGPNGPDHVTIWTWRQDLNVSEIIQTQREELIIRSGRRTHSLLDAIESHDPETLTHSQRMSEINAMNMLRGTNEDKRQREQQTPTQINITALIDQRAQQLSTEQPSSQQLAEPVRNQEPQSGNQVIDVPRGSVKSLDLTLSEDHED